MTDESTTPVQRPGRRQGATGELTSFWHVKPGHEAQVREVLAKLDSAPEEVRRHAGMLIGTLHERRWVLFDNDTRMMFCTSYDGEWDPYIEAFAEHNASTFNAIFEHIVGFPELGMNDPNLLDYITDHQVTANEYVRFYDGTVQEITRAITLRDAFEKLLDVPEFQAALENPALKPLLDTPEFQTILEQAAG